MQQELTMSLGELITQGGDDRLDILESGFNKYNVCPERFEHVFNRASCTCSPFSPDGYEAAHKLFERLSPEVFDEARERQIADIKSLLNFEGCDRFDVFFAPSGSDLCYYPLLFAKLVRPDRGIFNLITCPEELGSGSIAAFAGKYFVNRNQFGEAVEKGSPISEDLDIECASFAARDEHGTIIDHRASLLEAVHEKYHSHSVNANLVIGSKSGIENNISIVAHTPEDILWTIDLCQFRATRTLINGLLGMNCSVMLTGSKFYQSPPFCAALLVPKTISTKFKDVAGEAVSAFSGIFSKFDIPPAFGKLRGHLREFRNYGLLLRWEAALAEMKGLAALDSYTVNQRIDQWNDFVIGRLHQSPYFSLMPGQTQTNKTIISFRVKSAHNKYLNHEELLELYRNVCQTETDRLNGAKTVLFGQPVQYGDKSFIRIALGSSDARKFVTDELDLANDAALIELIERYIETKSCKS